MSLVLRPPGTRPLTERLADLGRARRAAAVLASVFALTAALTAAALAACLLDAAFHLPTLPRAGLLAGLLAAAGLGWLRLVRPAAREPVRPLAVALKLEAKFPRLNDALASAVAFLEAGPELSRFQQMARLRAENLTERLDLERSVPARRAWVAFWLLVLTVAGAAAVAAVSPARTVAGLLRLADPFGVHPWPTRTVVALTDPATLLAVGDPYPLRFTVAGRMPEAATVSVRPVAGVAADETVPVPDDGAVSRTLDPGRVGRDFEVRVTAGDGDTGWTRVEVAPPPKLIATGDRPSPQVRLSFPAYTGLAAVDLPDGTGVVEGVAGTRVSLRATADRDLRSAVLVPQFDLAPFRTLAAVAPLAVHNPLSVIGVEVLATLFTADIPVACHGPELVADFVPPLPGLYALKFTDARGLTGTRLIDFRLFADPPPVVTLDRPAAGRDPLDLLPTAKLPVAAVAEDRPYAVRWLAIEYRVGADGEFRRLPLAQVEKAADLPAALGGGTVSPLRPPLVVAGRTLPVAGFTKPDGSPPADGDTITVRAAAADWDDRTALKEPGRSPEVEIRVANRESLEAKFQKELASLRPELLRMREELRAAREQPATDVGQQAADAAVRAAKARVDDPAAGMAPRTDRLRQTRTANGLPATPTTDKVEAAADAARKAAELLDQATDKPGDRDRIAAAEAEVGKLLERLEQWGGAGEVRGEARALQDQVQKAGEQADAATTPAERQRAADRLDRAADQAAGLVGKAGRLAVEKDAQAAADRAAAGEQTVKADGAAAEAEALRQSVREAGGDEIASDLRKAADELRKKRPGESADARRSAAERLGKLADPLAEPTRATTAETAGKLAAQQDELRKKTKQAAGIADPQQRSEQLQTLAREQQKLKDEADKLAERLTREKNEPAAAAAKAAAEQLAAAGEQLQRGASPTGEQADAEKQLDEVKTKLDPEKKPGEGLSREQRADLADKLKVIRDRQKAAVEEAARVVAAAAAAGQWERPLLASLGDLEEREAALAAEVRPFAAKELADLPVFAKIAGQAADAMVLAGKRTAARRDDAAAADALDPAADERLLTPMRAALRKLDQIVAAVSPDPPREKKPDAQPMPEGGDQPMPEGGPPPGGGNGVSPLAQLKALRSMQAEVAGQTADFAREHPDPATLTADEQAELAALEQTQRDVVELFGKLAAAFRQQEQP